MSSEQRSEPPAAAVDSANGGEKLLDPQQREAAGKVTRTGQAQGAECDTTVRVNRKRKNNGVATNLDGEISSNHVVCLSSHSNSSAAVTD